jgi:hypothetical protein
MAADQPDGGARGGIQDWNDRRLEIIPQAAKHELPTNPDFSPIRLARLEGLANRFGVFPAQAVGDIHPADLLRRDAEPGLERRIDPFVRKSSAMRRTNCKEQILCEIPVQPVAGFFGADPQPLSDIGPIRLADERTV